MNSTNVLKVLFGFVWFGVAACSWPLVDRAPQESSGLVFYANPDPLKGRQDVYNSMARAAKYNVDIEGNNLNKNISEKPAMVSVDTMIDEAERIGFDGWNIDFETLASKTGPHS